jgi:hypothetical protein
MGSIRKTGEVTMLSDNRESAEGKDFAMTSDQRSAAGLLSELGRQYPAYHRPVVERFAVLASEMAQKHQIHEPVFLYTKEDLIALCEAAAFVPSQVFSSSFGNVKGIFSPV